jgi:two-component system sensor histidine kinase TctE
LKTFRTDPDRFGIRARLLTLLIPAILALLAMDSWNDYRALQSLVQDAYDRSMLESANALRGGIGLAPDGTLRLAVPPFVLQTLHDDTGPRQRHLHVALTPHGPAKDNAAHAEVTLLGEADLPAPPPPAPAPRPPLRPPLPPPLPSQLSASAASPPASASSASSASTMGAPMPSTIWYDGDYAGRPVRVVALQSQLVDGRGQAFDLLVQAAESTGPRDLAQAASSQKALFRDARMVLVVVLLVWLGVTWSLQRLQRLRKSVLQSRSGELRPLDTSEVPHEVAPLVSALNEHVASYRALLDQQSQFLADASHQLRTPLAIMLTQAGVALREKDPQQIHATLRAIIGQIARSRRLCEQLLSLAHASDNSPSEDAPELVDLRVLAKDVVLQYLALAHEKNLDLGWVAPECAEPTPATVRARGAELYEALANLVHNAIVYTPAGGHITVLVATGDGMAQVEVIDSGPGIAPARRAEVFERFRQAGPAQAGGDVGHHGAGLGLSIARAYARRNGGDIALLDADAAGTGLRAMLHLPMA